MNKTKESDYTPLIKQLKANFWPSADAETRQLIRKLSDRTVEGWIARTDVEKLEYDALLQIDSGKNIVKDDLGLINNV